MAAATEGVWAGNGMAGGGGRFAGGADVRKVEVKDQVRWFASVNFELIFFGGALDADREKRRLDRGESVERVRG